ncbi:BglG family transcription antiterminator [Massilicoli timonensis]|uniref:BglG family transcription antiterminator n=1 Tax=Massilicoli timonensis TaxID=2015901 RepID=UPI000C81883B|nr:BglG family transcription antiterminator [Massilicoli timonensis]
MIEKIDYQILKILMESDAYVSGNKIATLLDKSTKTIQHRIRCLEDELTSYGAKIAVKHGFGYLLVIEDQQLFDQLLSNVPYTEEQLVDQILSRLVTENGYLKSDDLTEEFFISKSTLTKILKKIRHILANYNLKIQMKPHYGIRIIGEEFDLRRFISSNYVQRLVEDNFYYFSKSDKAYCKIKQIIEKVFEDQKYSMPDYLQEALSSHLYISVKRIMEGKEIDYSLGQQKVSSNMNDLADELIDCLENEFAITFSASEREYILLQILSKRELDQKHNQQIPEAINQLVEKILITIRDIIGIDLLDDFNLRIMLGLHLLPLKFRLEHDVVLKNPICEQIKTQCVSGYELSLIAAEVIKDEWGFELSEQEISYFALHFNVALKKEIQNIRKKKILIVCGSGRATSQMIFYNFQQYFQQYIEKADICDVNQIERYLQNHAIDYIFTTVPLNVDTSIPVFEFSFFLNERTVKRIQSILSEEIQKSDAIAYFRPSLFFTNLDVKDKEEALDRIIDRVGENVKLPKHFKELVLKREELFTTDLLPDVALPHPIESCTDFTFVSVSFLKKSIDWGNQKVRLILLISMSKVSSEKYVFLYERIIKMLLNQEVLYRMIDQPDYETFINELIKASY